MVIIEEREVLPNSDFTPFIFVLFLWIKLISSVDTFNMGGRNPTYAFQKAYAFEHHFFFPFVLFLYQWKKKITCEEIKTVFLQFL